MRTAQSLAEGRDNNFNLIRMLAASAVIVSHSGALSIGPGAWEPFFGKPIGLGRMAVHAFFGMSGFFILKSFQNCRSFFDFALARISRIVPALAVVLLVTSLIMSSGINFSRNPYPDEVNGSLWTLRYEVICYAVLAILGICKLFDGTRYLITLLGYMLFFISAKLGYLPILSYYTELTFPFVLGMTAYRYRVHLPLHWAPSLALVIIAASIHAEPVWSLAVTYIALWLGSLPSPLLAYNRMGDYSYGTYLVGWPVQQLLAYSVPGIGYYAMMALALSIAWILAVLLWHFVERPSLILSRSSLANYPKLKPQAHALLPKAGGQAAS
jgi:peptidoglycan/LPS O-acetylase OafA/YrhL